MTRTLQHTRPVLSCAVLIVLIAQPSIAGDWPMWRYDAGRGASTPHVLKSDLHLKWVRQLPASRPAWPTTQSKLQFDVAPEPVVLGKRIFVPSNFTDSVTAFSTDTGELLWRFYADGPVRFAPVADQGRVYFVSDDAHLYALDAATGNLIWKRNGAPSIRPVLGNQRLISSWPARGGPVLYDGKVFFTTSIWPFMGIFIHAVDPNTGEIAWTNSGDGTNYTVHPHGAPSFGTVVPQGHLSAADGHLVVPGGRSVPAVYETASGKLLHFKFDKKSGSHFATATKHTYFVAGNSYSLSDGSRLGGGVPVIHDADALYYQDGKSIRVVATAGQLNSKQTKDRRGKLQKTVTLERKPLFQVDLQGAAGRAHMKAGDDIYTAGRGRVTAHRITNGSNGKPVWESEVEGDVWTMLAADEKLFIVTTDGRLHCFGSGAGAAPVELGEAVKPLTPKADRWAGVAQRVIKESDLETGISVAMGIGTGALIEQILLQSKFRVIAIDPDAEKVDRFRREMDAAGLYGSRVSARVGTPGEYSLPPYLANVIFCEDAASILRSADTISSLYRPLRPYGGTAYLPASTATPAKVQSLAKTAGLENAEVLNRDDLTLLVRKGALPGSDDWTHQYGNAAQTIVSQDKRVKAPLGVLWFGGESHAGILPRHGHGPSPQVAGGRLVIEGVDMLRCVDVYTGMLLWEKSLPGLGTFYNNTSHQPGAGEIGSNYVTLADHVYVVYGDSILELDAATGKTTKTFTLKPTSTEQPAFWGFLAVSGEYLIATSSPVDAAASRKSSRKPAVSVADDLTPVVKPHATWSYLAGSDPQGLDWTQVEFNDKSWKKGPAGFGYGDGDDKTELDMRGKFTRVYARTKFDARSAEGATELGLMLNYDDAFIAYLNGKEVARSNVGSGSGAKAKKIGSHEASGYEYIPFAAFSKWLRPGPNVVAIEGHNTSAGSSDFTLDPYVVVRKGQSDGNAPVVETKQQDTVGRSLPVTQYSSGSRRLVVFDRGTGKKLWSRDAVFNFRHNNIAVGEDKVFCIDRLTAPRLSVLSRRGITLEGKPILYALDLASGKVVWRDEEHVFGTFLNYSPEHDLLLQAGSQYRDRARDETGTGMIAYRGSSGDVIWKNEDLRHGGPCLLWKDKILTNGGGGFALEMTTGKETGWKYSRNYGCNTAVGSEHLLTFRSGAAGFFDLANDSGTGNIGGFKSSCTANLIVANGVLNAPDYTRTCSCAYQNQASLALVHMPEAEFWTFGASGTPGRTGINFNAPGDRRSEEGTLWLDVPSTGGSSEKLSVRLEPERPKLFRHHSSSVQGGELPWVAASGIEGIRRITIEVRPARQHQVRLTFLDPIHSAGQRSFDLKLQGNVVLRGFDIAKEAGGRWRSVSKSFMAEPIDGKLELEFQPIEGEPLLSGIELIVRDLD